MRDNARTRLIRAGFREPSSAIERIERLGEVLGITDESELLGLFEWFDPDPDGALVSLLELADRYPELHERAKTDLPLIRSGITLMAASTGIADFLLREPASLVRIHELAQELPGPDELLAAMRSAVQAGERGRAELTGSEARESLRREYRVQLSRIALFDIRLTDPVEYVPRVAAALADLAAATIEAALAVARTEISAPPAGVGRFPQDQVDQVRFAVIGMGKCGARELNYISDVDVMYVAEAAEGSELGTPRVIEIATRLAHTMTKVICEPECEPSLWEVDANLRPEGRDGALVRTPDSYVKYYERWAHNWEFQALIKARPVAGDRELGAALVDRLAPAVWSASTRDDFVSGVQAMRERVTANIPADEVDRQLKLGPGGLRDIEFTVQLLQLVHGHVDPTVRERSTLAALPALVDRAYIGADDGAQFIRDYRFLRLLEHRVQLRHLTRTHLFPDTREEQSVLARATRFPTADALIEAWQATKKRVRGLHEKVFYRPLLAAAAALPSESFLLTNEQAQDRLRAIGYRDPRGAFTHIRAMVQGVSRRATMQRNLLPILLDWFTLGANPDQGLLAFRKLSERLGDTPWYLRLLRDSNLAARRLCSVLSSSAFCATFIEVFPESVRWLDDDARLRPVGVETLEDEATEAVRRQTDETSTRRIISSMRRREILRLALGFILGVNDIDSTAAGLTAVATATLRAACAGAQRLDDEDYPPLAIIGMGRFGGAELGFGSDLDVLYVVDATGQEVEGAVRLGRVLVHRIGELVSDPRMPIDLDADLRPEGRNGAIVRTLEAYESYYRTWSLGWEAQALLRARGVAGDPEVQRRFLEIADATRYRSSGLSESNLVEIRRIKARVESERLPRGADPKRHLKLGRGSLSDVEWLVQTLQLQHAHDTPGLRTTSTLDALDAAREAGYVTGSEEKQLRDAWLLAGRIRSAVYLCFNSATDVLPDSASELDQVARLLGYDAGHGVELENHYLETTRRSRKVFERLFYGD